DDHRPSGADLPRLLQDLRAGRAPGTDRWRRERERLTSLAQQAVASRRPAAASTAPISAPSAAEQAGAVLALARPERIARRTGEGSRSYLLASGTRAALPEGSGLLGAPWLAVWEVQRAQGRAADGTGAVVRAAAPLDEQDALLAGEGLLREERTASLEGSTVRARRRRALRAIELSSTPVAAGAEEAGRAAGAGASGAGGAVARHGRGLAAGGPRDLAGPAALPPHHPPGPDRRAGRAAAAAAVAGGGGAGPAGAAAARGPLGEHRPDRLPRPGGGGRPARGGGEAAGAVRPRGDTAPGARPGPGAVPSAVPGPSAARGHRRSALVLGRALPGGAQGDARPVPQASLARGSVDRAGHGPHHTARRPLSPGRSGPRPGAPQRALLSRRRRRRRPLRWSRSSPRSCRP